jgi:hypothetical protein
MVEFSDMLVFVHMRVVCIQNLFMSALRFLENFWFHCLVIATLQVVVFLELPHAWSSTEASFQSIVLVAVLTTIPISTMISIPLEPSVGCALSS